MHCTDRATYAHYHHLPDVEWLEEVGKNLKTKEASARKPAVSKIMHVRENIWLSLPCADDVTPQHASECEDW